jgi:outer membrane protein insertion porin family
MIKFLIIFIFSYQLSWSSIEISDVQVTCDQSELCLYYQEKLNTLKGIYRNETHFRQTLKLMMGQGGVMNLIFDLEDLPQGKRVKIDFITKKLVKNIFIKINDDTVKSVIEKNIKIKSDQYFNESDIDEEILRLRELLSSRGYPSSLVTYSLYPKSHFIDVVFHIDLGQPQIIEEFNVETDSWVLKKFAHNKLLDLVNKNYDQSIVRNKLDELEKELFDYGYYLLTSTYVVKNSKMRVIVNIKFDQVIVHHFDILENQVSAKMKYLPLLKDLYKRYKKTPDIELVQSAIGEDLRKSSYFSPKIEITSTAYKNHFKEIVSGYKISISTGSRTRVRSITFLGNKSIDTEKILSWYKRDAFELASQNYLDQDYLTYFSNSLKASYIRRGFVRCDIAIPKLTFSDDQSSVDINYDISEGYQVKVQQFQVNGVTSELQERILKNILTREGKFFNPMQFEKDLARVLAIVQNEGYYHAEIKNLRDDNIVTYSKNKTSVVIKIDIDPKKLIKFNNAIIVGNKKTKEKIIRRRIFIKHGQVLAPKTLKDLENNLTSTGLFTSVKVTPINHTGSTPLTDVLIQIFERDYGLIEIAPGYRTDIGVKVSVTGSYGNLWGRNKAFSIRGQVNQRLDYQTLDPNRREMRKRLLEYNITNQFSQANVFDSPYEHATALSVSRRRFYSFDADISRISNNISRDFNQYFSASLRHQYESINQFNATEARDVGSFNIGALTPSVTFDLRNNRLNATSGAFLNWSMEVAKPYFLSQSNEDIKIDFYKLVTRNRFYVPFKNGTLALSFVGGVQENLARDFKKDSNGEPIVQDGQRIREGYIPSIKLFRLTGMDIVRGFTDEEINKLNNGRDIGDDRVQSRAYLANFKVEPRYFINDSLMTGVFWDAGRVFLNEFSYGDLRQSAGVTFKVLTPVGTLDFDYGIKLLRKRNADGSLESPGRFHVSIGFF